MSDLSLAEVARMQLQSLCPALSERGLDVLARMYTATHLEGTDGIAEIGDTKITPLMGAVLHDLVRQIGATRTLEVGFAYGFSTVWLLDALPADGRHVAIDPFERANYAGVGLRQVHALGRQDAFEWRIAMSIHALAEAIRAGERYDLIFIDGNHRFDDVLVDFYLADPLLRVGGVMAFDDLWMPSVRTATAFVETNRAYRRITQPEQFMAAFQKAADDARDWRHFAPFPVFRE